LKFLSIFAKRQYNIFNYLLEFFILFKEYSTWNACGEWWYKLFFVKWERSFFTVNYYLENNLFENFNIFKLKFKHFKWVILELLNFM